MWSALSASSTPFGDPRAQPQLSLPAFVYSPSVDAGLARWWGLARYGHDPGPGGRAARHRKLISRMQLALVWVTWRTACPTAQNSRTSGRSGALTLAWRPLMVHGGPPGSGFSTLGTRTTLRRSCGLTSNSWDWSAPVWNVRSHPAEHALPLGPTSPLAMSCSGGIRAGHHGGDF